MELHDFCGQQPQRGGAVTVSFTADLVFPGALLVVINQLIERFVAYRLKHEMVGADRGVPPGISNRHLAHLLRRDALLGALFGEFYRVFVPHHFLAF